MKGLAQQLKDKANDLYTTNNELQSTSSSSCIEENLDADNTINER